MTSSVPPLGVAGRARVRVDDWPAALATAAGLLVRTRAVDPERGIEILRMLRRLGPSVIVAPGVAMPHVRPVSGAGVASVALVTLQNPVPLGPAGTESVDVVILVIAPDDVTHLRALRAVSAVLRAPGSLAEIRGALDAVAVQQAFTRRAAVAA